jgi:membrane protease YdiL (CAAX protease family)
LSEPADRAEAGPLASDREATLSPTRGWPSSSRSLSVALATTGLVTVISRIAPDDYANTAVGVAFLGVTWFLALRGDTKTVRAFGLSLGGITEPARLEPRRIAAGVLRSVAWSLALALLLFPPFWFGFKWWHVTTAAFSFALPAGYASNVMGQLLVIALPEEAFFRGYLQSALDGRWRPRWRILGAHVGPGWLLAAFIFAIGHVLTIPHPARLAVFVPALFFGWLRARTGGIGASVLFHALCNLLSAALLRGYGLV